MEAERYWEIIASTKPQEVSECQISEALYNKLNHLPLADIIAFNLRTELLLIASYSSELWCAAYLINDGCGDDGFDYFRGWLISRGKEVFETAMESPDNLIEQVDEEDTEGYSFEEFLYIPSQMFSDKTQSDLYDFQEHPGLQYTSITLDWEEDDPASIKKICPRLYENFHNNAQ